MSIAATMEAKLKEAFAPEREDEVVRVAAAAVTIAA